MVIRKIFDTVKHCTMLGNKLSSTCHSQSGKFYNLLVYCSLDELCKIEKYVVYFNVIQIENH